MQLTTAMLAVGFARGDRDRRPDGSGGIVEIPVSGLGLPCVDNKMVADMGYSCRLLTMNLVGAGCDVVLKDLAESRGMDISRLPAEFSKRRVADACPTTCGLCELCAPKCALWFIGNGVCEAECNVPECQFDAGDCWATDCTVGQWSEWGQCSLPCDLGELGVGGTETRTRVVVQQPSLDGADCPPLSETRSGCNKDVICPTDCQPGQFSDWSPCSADCGFGEQSRAREVVSPAMHGGKQCLSLEQTRPCLQQSCRTDCQLSEWSTWSACDVLCGGGETWRSRDILAVPLNGGAGCGDLFETRSCNVEPCTDALEDSECWDSNSLSRVGWTLCLPHVARETCLPGRPGRSVTLLAVEARGPCTGDFALEFVQQRDCNEFECGVHCQLSEWTGFTDCPTCGVGEVEATRSVLVEPKGVGRACGETRVVAQCFLGVCSQDCIVGAWSEWSSCAGPASCGWGFRRRSRVVVTPPAGSGAACPPLEELEDCVVECEESGCVYSDFTDWSECAECGESQTERHQSLLRGPSSCELLRTESRPCSNGTCSSDVELPGSWSSWSACTANCGGGHTTRKRLVGEREEVEKLTCHTNTCPLACDFSEWGSWSTCSETCGQGFMYRERSLKSGPTECVATRLESECVGMECEMPCETTEWSDWSECDAPCGGGSQLRSREITAGTAACPPLVETRPCNPEPCTDCMWSDWSDWTECENDCAAGNAYRHRFRDLWVDGDCTKDSVESSVCGEVSECPVDCQWSGRFGDWSACSVACGAGRTSRSKTIDVAPQRGRPCPSSLIETRACLVSDCELDCGVSEWSPWSLCSRKCNGGDQVRGRMVTVTPINGGEGCPPLFESRRCNLEPCVAGVRDEDCVVSDWSAWDPCPVECGGATQHRTRIIERDAQPGGKACPPTKERRGCGLQRCPGPCEDSSLIEEVTDGVATCLLLKNFGCDEKIALVAQRNGFSFPESIPDEVRVKDACPVTCGACDECASECQLRDAGNGVCEAACNVEGCQFDLGDCGGDCDLSELDVLVTPAVKYLNVGGSAELACEPFNVFEGSAVLSKTSVLCQSKGLLVVDQMPTTAFTCSEDPCPYLHVQGLNELDGFYGRVPNLLRFELFQNVVELEEASWNFRSGEITVTASGGTCESPMNAGFQPWCLDTWTRDGVPIDVPQVQCLTKEAADAAQKGNALPSYVWRDRNLSPIFCEDQAEVADIAGFTCEQLAQSVGCNYHLASSGNKLPDYLNSNSQVKHVCPQSCGLCRSCAPGCPQWFVNNGYCDSQCMNDVCEDDGDDCLAREVEPQTVADPCFNDPAVLLAGTTCASLAGEDPSCLRQLGELSSELPLNLLPTLRVVDVCPLTCKACLSPRVRRILTAADVASPTTKPDDQPDLPIFCEDSPLIHDISGYSCQQLFMFFDTCDLYLADLPSDQEIPKAYRDYKILHACALTCGSCEELGLLLPGDPCINNAQFEETASCDEVTKAYSCETLLTELAEASGSPVPDHVPKGTRVKNVCVQSCGLCPEAGKCLDSPMVAEGWKTSCEDLLLYDHCDTPLKNAYFFSLRPFPSWFDPDVLVKSVCRNSCDACEAATSGLECRDTAASALLSESCLNLLRSNSCNKALDSLDHVFANSDVPGSTLIRDLCPATCGLCLVGSAVEDCGDSPLVAGFGVGCSELAVLGSRGCLTRMAEFSRFITDEAALNMLEVVGEKQLRAVCLEHCGACQQPTCVDGFVNGQEEDVDCGGPCRPCSSCNPSGLKPLHSRFRLEGTGLQHGSTRLLSCRGTAVLETIDVDQSISCRDGSWTEPQIVCKEATVETNALTLYFIGAAGVSQLGQDFFEFTSNVVTSDLPNSRVVRGGSCDVVAMQSQRWVCEDQKQLQELGVTCGLLKMMGCSKRLDVIAKEQSVSLPSTISALSIVADVCPVTCDDCAGARSRFYEMSPTSFRWIPGRCFQLDLFLDDGAARQLQTSSTRLFGRWLMQAQTSGLSALVFHQESMAISAPRASELFEAGKVHAGEVAWSLSITPAVITAEEWSSLDHGGKYMHPQSLFYAAVGQFRTGDLFDPDRLVTPSSNTRFLLRPHATAAASSLQGVCEDPYAQHSCCGLRQALVEFLDTPCGLFLYRGTLEQASFHSWCHSDCYSAAVEVVDRWAECEVQASAQELVAAWCSRAGTSPWAQIAEVRGLVYMETLLASATFRDLIDNSPTDGEYCMPSFLTESIPVDTLELISVDKATLASLCGNHSCTRHRLRYEFARAQLNVAFIGEGPAEAGAANAVLGRDAEEILDASCHMECDSKLVSLRTQTNLNGCTTCQSSMLLLHNQLPKLNRDLVEVPCEECYKAVTGALGVAMEYYGRLLRYPLHMVQGVTLRAASRVMCLQNTNGYFCGDFLRSANGVVEFETGDPASPCAQTCDGDFKGDGFCDLGCFNAGCHWDGRDCLAANIVPATFANLKGLVLPSCNPFEEAFSCSKECALAMDNRLQGCCQVYLLEMLRLLKLVDSEHPLYIGDAQLDWSPGQLDGLCERSWLSDCRPSTRTVLVPVSTSGSLGETTRGLVAYFRLVDGDVLAVVDQQTFWDVELNVDLRPEDIDLPRLEAFLAVSVGAAVDIPAEGVMLKLSAECDPQRLSADFPDSNYLIDPTGMISCVPEAVSEGATRGAVSCTAGRWVSVPSVVCRRPCPPFEPGSGMLAVSTNDFAVQVKCGEGYTSLMENEVLRCRDGVWDRPNLQCVTLCDAFDLEVSIAASVRAVLAKDNVTLTTAYTVGDVRLLAGAWATVPVCCAKGMVLPVGRESCEQATCKKGAWTPVTLLCIPRVPYVVTEVSGGVLKQITGLIEQPSTWITAGVVVGLLIASIVTTAALWLWKFRNR